MVHRNRSKTEPVLMVLYNVRGNQQYNVVELLSIVKLFTETAG